MLVGGTVLNELIPTKRGRKREERVFDLLAPPPTIPDEITDDAGDADEQGEY